METKFNFNSQVCTDRFQSERLLAIGLKPETADCMHNHCWAPEDGIVTDTPAWSLHRLLTMLDYDVQTDGRYISLPNYGFVKNDNIYDNVIDCIEWLIKDGYFNKEYLV